MATDCNTVTGLQRLTILLEDNHLLAVLKRPGLPTMGVAAGKASLLSLAKEHIKRRYRKPGNVYLGVVSRIDEPVSGVVLFARTSKAAARLSEQFRSRSVEKAYWAIVERRPEPPNGEWTDYIVKDERRRRMIRVERHAPGAQEARLAYRVVQPAAQDWLVEINPETGRKHQIRLQLSSHGYPIHGDRKYGSRREFPLGIALHARRLAFDHPVSNKRIELTAPVPESWRRWGIRSTA
ncbi:MAG TPA: RluA family pseudouridine synthase [Pirellulales bacterium]|nr:RluA family pseudouridine synthase [Pirellulales bacterium]